MEIVTRQTEMVRQKPWLGRAAYRAFGFTMVELITIILILGVISVTAIPRFFERSTFDSRGFYDQVISTLRYAQKAAIAKHRFVCVNIAANNVALRYGADSACAVAGISGTLNIPPGTPSINAPNGVTVTAINFSFDSLGRPNPNTKKSIAVSGSGTITVEAETGYVH